jgi:hypothetical protein
MALPWRKLVTTVGVGVETSRAFRICAAKNERQGCAEAEALQFSVTLEAGQCFLDEARCSTRFERVSSYA